jgi:hypothetical protein
MALWLTYRDELTVLSIVSVICFVSAFFWGIRGPIICLTAPYVLASIATLVRRTGHDPGPLDLSWLALIALFGRPWLVPAFISSALGVTFRSFIRRRLGR